MLVTMGLWLVRSTPVMTPSLFSRAATAAASASEAVSDKV
jgi:hypothetical protein